MDERTISVDVRPLLGTMKAIGQVWMEFSGIWAGTSTPRPFVIQMPMDRRQARRVSRHTGRTFRFVDGAPVFRAVPQSRTGHRG